MISRMTDSVAVSEGACAMGRRTLLFLMAVAGAGMVAGCCGTSQAHPSKRDAAANPGAAGHEKRAAGIVRAGRGILAPVYAPLAEQIVGDFGLADKEGTGIDVGSGPGTLIIELAKRTKMHWINADINPQVFPGFARLADACGLGHRVGMVRADAQDLPFRDNYADVIVSRGSYHFWDDRKKGFQEIYRVLKPGAVAYVGRGFSRDLPLETARRIRSKQGKKMRYDRRKAAEELRTIMTDLGIAAYRIDVPKAPGGEDVNYGIWIEFRKPPAKGTSRD